MCLSGILGGCVSSPVSTRSPTPLPSVTMATPSPSELFVPHNFHEACTHDGVCVPDEGEDVGDFPADLKKPLALPSIAPGQPCPVKAAKFVKTQGFSGNALGSGPVRPLFFERGFDAIRGIDFTASGERDGWFSEKTLWFADPSYQGPLRIRGARIDAAGPVAFGYIHNLAELIFPDGPTLNESDDGYREAPVATWLKTPGCYAWQVDGLGFSNIIVFRAI